MWWRLPIESKLSWVKESDSEVNSIFNESFARELSMSGVIYEPNRNTEENVQMSLNTSKQNE